MHLMALILAFVSTFAFAQHDQKLPNGQWAYYGEEFYAGVLKKNLDRTLFNKIFNSYHGVRKGKHDEIAAPCTGQSATCYRHTWVSYEDARKIMFGELDKLKDAQGTYVLDVYCGKKFYYTNINEVGDMHTEVNIEHTWPQSKFNGNFPKGMQKSDMHHLFLADSQANSVRGNGPFGLVDAFESRFSSNGCHDFMEGIIDDANVYTPPAQHRGNVARALFYFSMHYNLGISQKEETVLRRWHKEDPVDAKEIARHAGIGKYQKVRNPFVDHPEIVDFIKDF